MKASFLFTPLLLFAFAPTPMPAVKPIVDGPRNPDGTEVQCDLPTRLHLNRGGSDGPVSASSRVSSIRLAGRTCRRSTASSVDADRPAAAGERSTR